jgi:hypothetical protein
MTVPVIGSSAQRHLTDNFGHKRKCPVFFSLRNIDSTIGVTSLNHAIIVVALIPGSPTDHLQQHGLISAMTEQWINNQEVLRKVFNLFVCPLNVVSPWETSCFG